MISSGVDYRSIEGPKVKKDESDIDENDSDKEEGESFDEYVRRRKIEFEKELSEVQLYIFLTREGASSLAVNLGSTQLATMARLHCFPRRIRSGSQHWCSGPLQGKQEQPQRSQDEHVPKGT